MSAMASYSVSKTGLFVNEQTDVLLVTNDRDTQFLYRMVFSGQGMSIKTTYPDCIMQSLSKNYYPLIIVEISSEETLKSSLDLIEKIYQQEIIPIVILGFDVAECIEQLRVRNLPIYSVIPIPNFSNDDEIKKFHTAINNWKEFFSFKPNQAVTLDQMNAPVADHCTAGSILLNDNKYKNGGKI